MPLSRVIPFSTPLYVVPLKPLAGTYSGGDLILSQFQVATRAPQRNRPDSGPQRHLTGSTFPADKPAASQEWTSHSFPHAGLKYSPSHPVFPEAFQTRTPHLLINACFLSRYHCSAQIRYESCKHRLSGRRDPYNGLSTPSQGRSKQA